LWVLFFLSALGVLQSVYFDTLARWISAERNWSTREGESLAINLLAIIPQLWFQVFALQWTTRDVGFGTVLGATATNMFGITTILAKVLPGTLPLATTTATAIAAAVAASLEGEEDQAAAAAAAAAAASAAASTAGADGAPAIHAHVEPGDKVIVPSSDKTFVPAVDAAAAAGATAVVAAAPTVSGPAGTFSAVSGGGLPSSSASSSSTAVVPLAPGVAGVDQDKDKDNKATPNGTSAGGDPAQQQPGSTGAEKQQQQQQQQGGEQEHSSNIFMNALSRVSRSVQEFRMTPAERAIEKAARAERALREHQRRDAERRAKRGREGVGFTVFWYRTVRDSFAFCVSILLLVTTTISSNRIGPIQTIPLLIGLALYGILWLKSAQLYQWLAKGVKHATVCLNSTDEELNPNQGLIAFLEGNVFAAFINLLIMFSVVSVVWDEFQGPGWLTSVNFCFSAIFILECIVKNFAYGIFGYWKDGLNAFDGVLVVLILFELMFSGGSIAGSVRVVRLFRFLRTLRGMRAMRVLRGIQIVDGKIVYVKQVSKRKAKGAALAVLAAQRAAAAAAANHELQKENQPQQQQGGGAANGEEKRDGDATTEDQEHSGMEAGFGFGAGLATNRKFSAIGAQDGSNRALDVLGGGGGAADGGGAAGGPATAPAPPRRRVSGDAEGMPLSVGVDESTAVVPLTHHMRSSSSGAAEEGAAAPPHTQQLADRAPPPVRAGGPLLSPVAATPAGAEQDLASPSGTGKGPWSAGGGSAANISSPLSVQRPLALVVGGGASDSDIVTTLTAGAAGPMSTQQSSASASGGDGPAGGTNPLTTPVSLFRPVAGGTPGPVTGVTMAPMGASSGDEGLISPPRRAPPASAAIMSSPAGSASGGFSSGGELQSPSAAGSPAAARRIVLLRSNSSSKRLLKPAMPRAAFKRPETVVAEEDSAAAAAATLQRNEQWLQQQHDLSHGASGGAAAASLPPGSRLLLQNRLHHVAATAPSAEAAVVAEPMPMPAPSATASAIEMHSLARSLFPASPKGQKAAAVLDFVAATSAPKPVMVDAATEVHVDLLEGTLSPVEPAVEHVMPGLPLRQLSSPSQTVAPPSLKAAAAASAEFAADPSVSPSSSPLLSDRGISPLMRSSSEPPEHLQQLPRADSAASSVAPTPPPQLQPPSFVAARPSGFGPGGLGMSSAFAAPPAGDVSSRLQPRGAPAPIGGAQSSAYYMQALGLVKAPVPAFSSPSPQPLPPGSVEPHERSSSRDPPLRLREARVARAVTHFVPKSSSAAAGGSGSATPGGSASPGGAAGGGGARSEHVRRVSTSIQLGGHHRDPAAGGGARVGDSSMMMQGMPRQMSLLPVVNSASSTFHHHQHDGFADTLLSDEELSVLRQNPPAASSAMEGGAGGGPPTHRRRRSSVRRQSLQGTNPAFGRRGSSQAAGGALFTVRGSDAAHDDKEHGHGHLGSPTGGDGHHHSEGEKGPSRQRTSRYPGPESSGPDHSMGRSLGSRQHSISGTGSSRGGRDSDDDDGSSRGSSYGDDDTEYTSDLGGGATSSDYPSTEWDSDASSDEDGDTEKTHTTRTSRKQKRHVRAWTVLPKHLFWLRKPVAFICLFIMCCIVIASFALGVLETINPQE
jgi:hypothetical protein